MRNLDLSVIIVNYKTAGLVVDCLRTVYSETRGIVFEVIVVDNDSGDGSMEAIIQAYPAVRWIQMGYNAGFARANNEGIRQSAGRAVLLLNSDTMVENGAVDGCCREFAGSPYVACGVQLLNPDRTPQISGSFFVRGGLNHLLPLPFLGGLLKAAGRRFGAAVPNIPEARSLVEVDWVNGAFLMVKRDALALAGLMDEDFFLYAEEIEWCSRLRKLGKLALYGQFHVVHIQGATANERFGSEGKGYYNLFDRKGLQIMLSNFVRIRKQFGVTWFVVQLAFYWLEIPVFCAGLVLSGLFRRGKGGYSWKMLRGYCRNVGYITAKSRTIIRNKPYFYKVL
ncbi:MAG TPA: glycosyltransferase family 2 protein [Puia sp.]|nr:glycosyltransferase family 2 protein [Puia sp.]